jgi:mRNA-degrading endonuclease RelE of RelBE toxin-antitoxin system
MNIKIICDPFQEMAYPTSFNMETLLSQPSYAKKIKYAEDHLTRLASGSSRVVFKIDDEKVLKVAKNEKGIAQNTVESDWGIQKTSSIVAKVFESDENNIFVEMEYAKKITPSLFKKIVGVSLEELHQYLVYYVSQLNRQKWGYAIKVPENVERFTENDWIKELIDLYHNFDILIPGDFGRISSYGLVLRNEIPTVVITDFGLTDQVYQDYYKK